MNDRNPYQSPTSISAETAVDARRPAVHVSWTWRRVALGVMAMGVHGFFLTILANWSFDWAMGWHTPSFPREYGMVSCAFLCALSSAVVVYGILRGRSRPAIISMLLCLLSFAALMQFDLLR